MEQLTLDELLESIAEAYFSPAGVPADDKIRALLEHEQVYSKAHLKALWEVYAWTQALSTPDDHIADYLDSDLKKGRKEMVKEMTGWFKTTLKMF